MSKMITVVDSMMGTGKTTAMINKMIADESHSYIFVTIYKTEIQRIMEATNGRFCEPENKGAGKLDDLHKKLRLNRDIAMTHALLLRANDETIQLIREGNYILVLDEVLNVFQEYNEVALNNYFEMRTEQQILNKPSVGAAIANGQMHVDMDSRLVTYSWDRAKDTNSELLDILSRKGVLRWSDDTLYVEYPIEVFDAFTEIYVLTYMYEHSILAAYFGKHNYESRLISAKDCQLVDWYDDLEGRRAVLSLLKIYMGVANKIGAKNNAFSVSWSKAAAKDLTTFQKILSSMETFKKCVKAIKEYTMITTSKDDVVYNKFKKAGYAGYTLPSSAIKDAIASSICEHDKWSDSVRYYEEKLSRGDELDSVEAQEYKMLLEFGEPHVKSEKEFELFVSCTARATNMYRNRKYLMYMINRFLSPDVIHYFQHFGVTINEGMWAVSEMLQWIFRSQIRDGKPVNIFIPSYRMRYWLFRWANTTEEQYIKDVLGITAYRTVMYNDENAEDSLRGRPAVERPANWNEVIAQLEKKEITATRAIELTGVKKTTFYKLREQDQELQFCSPPVNNGNNLAPKTKQGRPAVALPENWDEVMIQLHSKKITAKKAMELTGLKKDKFYEFKKQYEQSEVEEDCDESKNENQL